MLKVTKLELDEVLLLEYDCREDQRGRTMKLFSQQELKAVGIETEFVEENLYCISKKGTLYGIHFQNHPKAQTKLLYCLKGRGLDFAIDLRADSKTYKQWVCVELNPGNNQQIYIPAGFGHAFLSLEDDTQLVMKIDRYFETALARAITYADPQLKVDFGVLNPTLSEMDRTAPTLAASDCNL